MAIFVVSSVSGDTQEAGQTRDTALKTAVEKEIAQADRINLTPFSWLVAFKGTVIELKEKLGIKKGGVTGFVSSAPEISGIGPNSLAQWITSKQSEG